MMSRISARSAEVHPLEKPDSSGGTRSTTGGPDAPAGATPSEPGMGIRFLYGSDEERRSVESVVERMMIDSLGQLIYSKLMRRGPGPNGPNGPNEPGDGR